MRKKLLAVSFAASLLLVGCGAPANQDLAAAEVMAPVTDLDTLIADAQEEGTLLLYTSLTEGDMEQMTKGFTEKYGIDVQALRLGGTDAATRFDTETQAKAPSADLLVVADPVYIGDITSRGDAIPLQDTGLFDLLDEVPEAMDAPEIGSAIVQIVNAGIAYNTDAVSADEVPKTWEDLQDERWKGKLIGTSPDASANNLVQWGKLYDELGADGVKAIGANISRTYPNLVPLHESLATGEGDIALQSAEFFVELQKSEGKKIEFVNLQPSVYPTISIGLSARAENPAAARLLAHYLMTEEGGQTITNPEVGSLSPYDEELIPEDFEVISPEISERYTGMKQEINAAFEG